MMLLLLIQDRQRMVAAGRAVLVHRRPGRMEAVVRATWHQAAAPRRATVPLAAPPSTQAAAGVGRNGPVAAVPRFGSPADNALIAASVGAVSVADWWHVDENVFKAVEAL